jgi:hypothetical protein
MPAGPGVGLSRGVRQVRRDRRESDVRREMLHIELQGAVYDNFASGNYDTSVRDAFVQVEIRCAHNGCSKPCQR